MPALHSLLKSSSIPSNNFVVIQPHTIGVAPLILTSLKTSKTGHTKILNEITSPMKT